MLRNVKSPLPVDGHRSKTPLLKFPILSQGPTGLSSLYIYRYIKIIYIFLFQVPTLWFSLLQISVWFNLFSFNIESQTYFPLYNLH